GLLAGAAGRGERQRRQRVALVTFQGSLCPVTLAHAQALREAAALLRDDDDEGFPAPQAPRPRDLPVFDTVLGLVGLNDDEHVRAKLASRRSSAWFMLRRDRRLLVDMAIAGDDWIVSCDNVWSCAERFLATAGSATTLPGSSWTARTSPCARAPGTGPGRVAGTPALAGPRTTARTTARKPC
ncbi:unnamed protein product, partial [Prorocentrum cordatum]